MKRCAFKSFGMRLSLIGLLLASPVVRAQQMPKELEPREAIGGLLMAGLVGGILGLSTLSFYDKPQDNIRNISIGAGVGMIASALYLTYSVAGAVPAASLTPSIHEAPQWAFVPDWDPKTTEMKARYVVRF
ncbi:MAG: hypothetical protein ABIR96_08070 [Bdellovibrionota bacterium]